MLESNGVTGVLLSLECGLELGRRDVADGLQEPAVVEPVDPLQGGVLDLVKALPGAASADQLGLVQPDRGLAEPVVQGVADGPDRRDQPLQQQCLAVMYCGVLTSGAGIKPNSV